MVAVALERARLVMARRAELPTQAEIAVLVAGKWGPPTDEETARRNAARELRCQGTGKRIALGTGKRIAVLEVGAEGLIGLVDESSVGTGKRITWSWAGWAHEGSGRAIGSVERQCAVGSCARRRVRGLR